MTDLSPAKLNAALLDANGDFAVAASMLGITEEWLRDKVKDDDALRLRWIEAPKAPPASSLINRPEEKALAEAMKREEETLRRGVEGLKLSARAQNLAVALQKFQRENFSHCVQITSAGITATFLEVMASIEELNGRIADADNLPDEKRVALESIWREDRSRLLDFLYKASMKVDQGVLIQAKIQKMMSEGKGGAPSDKPGFRPLKKVVEA